MRLLKNTLRVMLRKLKEEIQLKHPPYPPSKEGGILAVFPLSKGGLRGIVPKTFPSLIEIHDVKGDREIWRCVQGGGYKNNELFQWVLKSLTGS